ncbi:phage protein NinX family protein [Edwardsiella tarda]
MNYAEMSDSFIAQEIARHEGIALWPHAQITLTSVTGVKKSDGMMFDPCNNPNDIWPLIIENGIVVKRSGDECIATSVEWADWMMASTGNCYSHDNPLRAAAIVYLMMKEAGK